MNDTAIKFLSNLIPDHLCRHIDDYFKFDHVEMEKCHGWVQWAFPIDTPSLYNPDAPLITEFDSTMMPTVYMNQELLFIKFLGFIGITFGENVDFIDFKRFAEAIDGPNNHNLLRISRVIKHCKLTNNTRLLYRAMPLIGNLIKKHPERFSPVVVAYWYTMVYDFQNSGGFF